MSVDLVGSPDGVPRALLLNGRWVTVAEQVDSWLIEDEWWRTPLARRYLRLLLANGRALTVFVDLARGGWYLQSY